jgi:glycosyltransferase involved in cell wall biosynthesis
MSVRNEARFVAESIDSVLKQSVDDFEFLIVNDRSTDSSASIINSFHDHRIKLLTPQGSGLASALNQMLSIARGVYVARQDADDISKPERFERQISYLESNHDVGVLGTSITAIDQYGRKLRDYDYPHSDGVIRDLLYRMQNPLVHGSLMYRRQPILDIKGYRSIFKKSEDYDMHLRLGSSVKFANITERLLKYRIRLDSMSVDRDGEALRYSMFARALAAVRQECTDEPSGRTMHEFQEAFDGWFATKGFLKTALSGYYRKSAMLLWYAGRRIRSLNHIGLSILQDPLWPIRERLLSVDTLWSPRIEREIIDIHKFISDRYESSRLVV